eukprot:scaffold10016_cov170-Amphora_coffeaeformis.AAC.9
MTLVVGGDHGNSCLYAGRYTLVGACLSHRLWTCLFPRMYQAVTSGRMKHLDRYWYGSKYGKGVTVDDSRGGSLLVIEKRMMKTRISNPTWTHIVVEWYLDQQHRKATTLLLRKRRTHSLVNNYEYVIEDNKTIILDVVAMGRRPFREGVERLRYSTS